MPLSSFEDTTESLVPQISKLDESIEFAGDCSREKKAPLLFLQKGFRELIKCRHVSMIIII